MSILLYAESAEGKFKKVALELASYAKKVADPIGTTVTALTVNATDVSEIDRVFCKGIFQHHSTSC